jgi:hypothetical protein
MDWVLQLLLGALDSLLTFNPIDLNADWWRSNYAYAFWWGLMFAIPVGAIYTVVYSMRGATRRSISALSLYAKVLFVGAMLPVLYGVLLELSVLLREGAQFGYTDEQLSGSVDVFRGLDFFTSIFYSIKLQIDTELPCWHNR